MEFLVIEQKPARTLTKLQYLNRFDVVKLAAIYAATPSDPMLQVLDKKLSLAEEINLDDPNTIAGLNYLVSKGLITAEDEAAIRA